MFDPCSTCRKRLAKRAEGALPRYQWAALEEHLSKCPACRRIDEADRALHLALSMRMTSTPTFNYERAQQFDDRVVHMLVQSSGPRWRDWLELLRHRVKDVFSSAASHFASQLVVGAVSAAALMIVSLSFTTRAGHGHISHVARHQDTVASAQVFSFRSGPPVPLEALLNNPAPVAAKLWSRPDTAEKRTASASKPVQGPTDASL